MQTSKNHNLFMDISGIDCRDTNISFSVQNILNHQYYPSLSIKSPQKIDTNLAKDKNTKPNLRKSKKEVPSTPKPTRKQQSKLMNKQSKCKDGNDEKDTEDNSQTVKIVQCKPVKQTPSRKTSKQKEGTLQNCLNSPSNKIPPQGIQRQRTKSNASVKSQRRVSEIRKDRQIGQAVSNNISRLRRNSSSKDKVSSKMIQKHGSNIEEIKRLNEKLVRNDYFQEMKVEENQRIQVAQSKKGKGRKLSQKQGMNNMQKCKMSSPRFQKK